MNWTIRLKHESRCHSLSTFLTLTYDDESAPIGLSIPDMQRFWKRLRKAVPSKIRHFYCGEYGDRTQRPHYHAAVFSMGQFPDSKKWDMENTVSETLNAIWGNGRVLQSELTPYRMAYVAGYVLKKAGYKKQTYCDENGEVMQAPFRRMSQGIGREWLEKYRADLREGCVHHEGYKVGIPRYYMDRLDKTDPELAERIQAAKDERRAEMKPPERARLDAAEAIRRQMMRKKRRDKI